MAVYKVIQDIESEDKLLGPLSLRQFIYAIITIAFGAAGFMLASKTNVLLAVPFLPPMALFGLLAAPFGRDQSSEVWLLAKIRFAFKPRRRIWDQTGMSDFVQILVPKKIEEHLTDGLDQTQVKSRLRALAETLDSRGWAVKNVTDTSVFATPSYLGQNVSGDSDRLLQTSLPAVPAAASYDDADMLDEENNPTAQKLENLIEQSEQARRQQLVATMQNPQAAPAPIVPLAPMQPVQAQPSTNTAQLYTQVASSSVVEPSAADQAALLDSIHQSKAAAQAANSHIKRIPTAEEAALAAAQTAKSVAKEGEIKRLAVNDDLDIATIARQAHKDDIQSLGDDEVVISLH